MHLLQRRERSDLSVSLCFSSAEQGRAEEDAEVLKHP